MGASYDLYMYTEKLKELSNVLILHENKLVLVPKYMEFLGFY